MNMTVSILPPPQTQFFDNNGNILAGGSIYTYVANSTTSKQTWKDPNQITANSNPVVLDSAGRCIMYGDGSYSLLLQDSVGNEVYNGLSDSYLDGTAISDVMLPVTMAETTQQARDLLGVTAAIQDAIDGVQLLAGPTGPVGPAITGPTGPQGATGAGYTPVVPPGLPSFIGFPGINGGPQIFYFQFGVGVTSGGTSTVAFPQSFASGCIGVWCNTQDISWWANATGWNNVNFTVTTSSPLHGGGGSGWPGSGQFNWLAIGY